MSRTAIVLAVLLVGQAAFVGCIGSDEPVETSSANETQASDANQSASNTTDPRLAHANGTGPVPPEGEDYTGLKPIQMIFDGSLRVTQTRVLLVPPAHGDLGSPTNMSRSGMAYLEATLEGIFAWEVAVDRFIEEHPEYAYLDNVTVQVELFEGETPATAGYDFVIGYAETSGPLFRGVAIPGPGQEDQQIQRELNDAGVGDLVHFGHRYVLLSLFAAAPRAGQQVPDYPETHEMRGVTMHEFAHVWGLGHSTTWTEPYGPDLMNSPYPYVYGDGDPAGDGGERSPTLCPTTLDLYGLAHLYRWLPSGEWNETHQNVSLPMDMAYKPYCDVFEDAQARADAWMAEHGLTGERLPARLIPGGAR